ALAMPDLGLLPDLIGDKALQLIPAREEDDPGVSLRRHPEVKGHIFFKLACRQVADGALDSKRKARPVPDVLDAVIVLPDRRDGRVERREVMDPAEIGVPPQ